MVYQNHSIKVVCTKKIVKYVLLKIEVNYFFVRKVFQYGCQEAKKIWKLWLGGPLDLRDLKNLVFTTCTSKIDTTFKAYILAIFLQNFIKFWQGGPLDLMDLINGRKSGVYHMNQQNRHNFEGLYLCCLWSKLIAYKSTSFLWSGC